MLSKGIVGLSTNAFEPCRPNSSPEKAINKTLVFNFLTLDKRSASQSNDETPLALSSAPLCTEWSFGANEPLAPCPKWS